MKNMKIGKFKPRHYTKGCSIYCHDRKLREKANEQLQKVKDIKPVRLLIIDKYGNVNHIQSKRQNDRS